MSKQQQVTHAHGTTGRYGRGCRCSPCRSAWASYMREYKRQRFGLQPRGSYYEHQDQTVPVRLSPLGRNLLDAMSAREGRKRGDVVERLLRQNATQELGLESNVRQAQEEQEMRER